MVLLARLPQWIVLEDRNESQSYQLSARERGVVLVRMYFIYTPAYWKTQGPPVQKYTTVGRLKQLTERRQAMTRCPMTDVRGHREACKKHHTTDYTLATKERKLARLISYPCAPVR
jgi:hypothetical protein